MRDVNDRSKWYSSWGVLVQEGDCPDGTPILVCREMASKSGLTPILCVQNIAEFQSCLSPETFGC